MNTEYDKQAADFLAATGTTLEVVYQYTGPYFPEDTEARDVYRFTLKNARGEYSARFGGSIRDTAINSICRNRWGFSTTEAKNAGIYNRNAGVMRRAAAKLKPVKPSAYDILACLSGYAPGTFREFCADYGYSTDSIKAREIYQAVQDEWDGLSRIYTREQLEQLADIN